MKNTFPPMTHRRWQARWIWADNDGTASNVYYYFRKTFSVKNTEACRLFISADTRYRLYVNGAFIECGPPQSQPYFQYYDEHDLSEALTPGVNTLAVLVYHLGTLQHTRGGLLAELTDADGHRIAASDDTWKTLRAKAWHVPDAYRVFMNQAVPFQEYYDARLEPEGWNRPDFDDAGWPNAEIVHGGHNDNPPAVTPWTLLVARDIPFMSNESVLPQRIDTIEECLGLRNRSRENDLAPGLSQAGKPLETARLENADALLNKDGDTILQCSTRHLDLDFDGVYDPVVVLDFGRIITARVRLDLWGVDGARLDIGYAERLIDGHFNIAMECEFADRYMMKDGEQTFETSYWRSFRYLKIRLREAFQPVMIHRIQGVISTFPYEERGGFHSEDETLNKVFDISRYTLRLCSNEFLMDTPWREQAQWLGDVALVTTPAARACFGDLRLTRKFLLQAGANQFCTGMLANTSNTSGGYYAGQIPDYSLWWVQELRDVYRYAGDEALLHWLYPVALRVIQAHLYYLNEDGLIENMPYWVFIDWADTDRRGVGSAYNAIFYAAAGAMLDMARLKNDAFTVEWLESVRARMKERFHAALFDPARECYADARVDGAFSDKISEHGNLSPVYAGLCDGETAARIIRRVFEEPGDLRFTEAQPFFMQVVLNALDRAGRFDLAVDLIRRRWGRRMVEKGAQSVYEEWYHNGSWRNGAFDGFLRTESHAWSACPAEFLIKNLIGLEILEPGCAKIRLTPKSIGADYSATYPTPKGPVKVVCKDGDFNINAPDEVTVAEEKR